MYLPGQYVERVKREVGDGRDGGSFGGGGREDGIRDNLKSLIGRA